MFDYTHLKETIGTDGTVDVKGQYVLICSYIDNLCNNAGANCDPDINVVLNQHTRMGFYCKIAGRMNRKIRKNSGKRQAEKDPCSLTVTKNVLLKQIRLFHNRYQDYHLLVNVVSSDHTMAVLISKINGKYVFKVYNCNHSLDGISNVRALFTDFTPREKFVRILTRKYSNPNGFCLALTWCYMYNTFIGMEAWSEKKVYRWMCLDTRKIYTPKNKYIKRNKVI